jgi:hypothetical protein
MCSGKIPHCRPRWDNLFYMYKICGRFGVAVCVALRRTFPLIPISPPGVPIQARSRHAGANAREAND